MEIESKSVLDEVTDGQRKILKEFRETLGVELNQRHTDELLVKFLRAKNFNLRAAKKIFLENYYNRITFGVNTILETYEKPVIAEKYETTGAVGFAKDGTLIRYIGAGRLDFYGFIMSMSLYELCIYFSYVMELDIRALEEESLRTGKNLTETTYIIDLEGFTLQQVLHQNVVEMGIDYVRLLQDCYPEFWRNVFIINVPKIFYTAFNLFRPVLRSAVLNKIQMLDKANTKSTLLQYIDADVLPEFLGGRRVDSKGDPKCSEFINFGGRVPEKFYSHNSRPLLSLDDPEVRLVQVGARSSFNVSIAVKEVGSVMTLHARTESGSLSLSVLYKEFGPDPNNPEFPGEFEYLNENSENCKFKQISVELRDQMHCTQENGKIMAHWPGIYVVRFNNSNNWFTSRKLYYKIDLTPPVAKSSQHPSGK